MSGWMRFARALLMGSSVAFCGCAALPHSADPYAPAAMSCEEIYAEIRQLMPQTYSYQPPFQDDPRNAIAGTVAVVFPYALLVWGYTAGTSYLEQRAIGLAEQRIAALRRASAERDCWVRR